MHFEQVWSILNKLSQVWQVKVNKMQGNPKGPMAALRNPREPKGSVGSPKENKEPLTTFLKIK